MRRSALWNFKRRVRTKLVALSYRDKDGQSAARALTILDQVAVAPDSSNASAVAQAVARASAGRKIRSTRSRLDAHTEPTLGILNPPTYSSCALCGRMLRVRVALSYSANSAATVLFTDR